MKKFIVFSFIEKAEAGGWQDFDDAFNSQKEAEAYIANEIDEEDEDAVYVKAIDSENVIVYQIVDLDTMSIIKTVTD